MPTLLRRFFRPEPTSLTIAGPDGPVPVDIRRSAAAKRITLRVSSATGRVLLTLPARTAIETARAFAEAQRGWIAARLAALPDRLAFVDGTTVPIRGVPHLIRHEPGRGTTRTGRAPDGTLLLLVPGDPAALPGRVRRHLAAEAGRDLRSATERYATRLGLAARRVTIRDTRSRWGSCSSTGALSFSWRLVLAPPDVLDYLAAHEVAHLRELNHSDRFWSLLRELCPGTDAAERWLKRHGAGLHRYG